MFFNRVVLDRVYSPVESSWAPFSENPSLQGLTCESSSEESKKVWKHFRPSSPTNPCNESVLENTNLKAAESDSFDNQEEENQLKNCESPSIESLFFDAGLDGFRIPSSDSSPPCVTNSNFNIIGDTLPTAGKVDLDWWEYFDAEHSDDTTPEGNSHELKDNKRTCLSHINGVGSPSTATDSPFWKIPKSASLPNNDW